MKVISLLLSFIFFANTQAQTTDKKLLQITFAPMSLLVPMSGVLEIGMQKDLGKKFALCVDYGLRFNKFSIPVFTQQRNDYRYSKSRVELKYFLKYKEGKSVGIERVYVSLQAFYFPQHYRKDNDWLITNGKSYHYEYSSLDRKASAISSLAGMEVFTKSFVFDFYVGVGVRKLIIQHHPVNAVEGSRSEPTDWGPTPIDLYKGVFYRANFPFGVRIGYKI
jgi:hypothetical protein